MKPNRTISKKSLGILILMLFGQCGLFGQSDAESTPTHSAIKDFFYTGIDGQSHIIKVYFQNQKPKKKAPCAVFFHGGGLAGGSHTQFRNICEYLAARGMVSITADYSLTNKEARAALPGGKSWKRDSVIDAKVVSDCEFSKTRRVVKGDHS